MKRTHRWWSWILAVAVCLSTGLMADGARAQDEGDGGWFEAGELDEGQSSRPLLRIHGTGPYDPPPPDFQSEPPRDNWEDADATKIDEADEPEDDAEAQTRAVSEFSPHLSAYGYWVDDSVYGRVWVPTRKVVGPDFSPYVTGGHWELSVDDEWTWVSDYPFGWITFHYGRWAWLGGPGWAWVPGYRYSPAWVDFRIGVGGYIGWGPLPPYWGWHGGAYVSIGVRHPLRYTFCATTHAFSHSLHRHVIRDGHRVHALAADTHRYRPHRVNGHSRMLRGPSAAEARIPNRALPSRRTVARPRLAEFSDRRSAAGGAQYRQRAYQRHESGGFDRSRSSARRGHGDDRGSRGGAAPNMDRRGTGNREHPRQREWSDDDSRPTRTHDSRNGGAQRSHDDRRSRGDRPSYTPRGSIDHGNPAHRSTPPRARTREVQQEPSRGTVRRAERSSRGRSSGTARPRSRSSREAATTSRTEQRSGRDSGGSQRSGRDSGGSQRGGRDSGGSQRGGRDGGGSRR